MFLKIFFLGNNYCTASGKEDEEYEVPKEEKCFRAEDVERHDYYKVG